MITQEELDEIELLKHLGCHRRWDETIRLQNLLRKRHVKALESRQAQAGIGGEIEMLLPEFVIDIILGVVLGCYAGKFMKWWDKRP